MPNWAIYLITGVVLILIFVIFSILKKNFIKEMSKILYADNDSKLFIEKINGFKGKLFLNKKTRLFRLIDVYAMTSDHENVLKTFKELESKKLSFGQQVMLYEKKVEYCCEHDLNDEAIKANEKIQELNVQVEIEDLNKIAVNCDAMVKVYVLKDGTLANEMVKMGDEANIEIVKGTYYFRAAKCYFYKGNEKMVDKYLNKAHKYLLKTSMKKEIEDCINNHNKLA